MPAGQEYFHYAKNIEVLPLQTMMEIIKNI